MWQRYVEETHWIALIAKHAKDHRHFVLQCGVWELFSLWRRVAANYRAEAEYLDNMLEDTMRRALHTWEAFAARILAFHALRICGRRALLKWRRRREERYAPTRRALGFYRRTSKRRAWRVWLQQRDVLAAWAVLRKRAMWHAAMTQRYRLLRRWRANARRTVWAGRSCEQRSEEAAACTWVRTAIQLMRRDWSD